MKMTKYLAAAAFVFTFAATAGSAAFSATEIQFWHSMTGVNSEKLTEITEKFNREHKDYRIALVNKGSYAETMTAAIAAFRAGGQPHILQVYEVGTGTFMAAGKVIYPVQKLMEDEGIPFDPGKFLPAVTLYYSTADGRMLSFPFNSSTMVMYYNKDAFRQAGLDPDNPPRTWKEVAGAARRIVTSGTGKCGLTNAWPSWAHIENFSAWHNIPMGTRDNGFGGLDAEFTIDNPTVQRHWNNLVQWQREGIYTYGGRASTALASFTSGNCAMLIESSGGRGDIVNAVKFAVGIGMMPYYEDVKGAPQNTIIGGASLWVMNGKARADYKGVAEYFAYLSRPEVQAAWSQFTGYLPVTTAAFELGQSQGYYERNPGTDIAVRQLNLNPPTGNSRGLRFGNFPQIRTMFEEELEKALNGAKTAGQALHDAQKRGNEELRRFEAVRR